MEMDEATERDTSSSGMQIFQVLGTLAVFERDLIQERTAA